MGSKLGNATNTTLKLGSVESAISLYKTTGDRDRVDFEAAGPHGGVLRKQTILVEAMPEETAQADPLAVRTAAEAEADGEERARSVADVATALDSVPAATKDILVETGYEKSDGEWVEVTPEMIRRGLRVDDKFIDVTEGLEKIRTETILERMEVLGFIRRERVPRERIEGSYWVAPGLGGNPRVLRLLYEAMYLTGRVAVVRWTKRTRQALGILVPHGQTRALIVLEVTWAALFREPDAKVLSLRQAEITENEIHAAASLIDAMSESVHLVDEIDDEAETLRAKLYADALEGKVEPVQVETPELPEDLVDLFRGAESAVRA